MTAGPIDPALGAFPASRMRRNRTGDAVRRMVAECRLSADDFIWPVFVPSGARPVLPHVPADFVAR